ncbi:hypothetical protein [Roseateles sp. PN1]|uniref:hypothetical protein n=1 Tax=Roseateles sp. PN1 TaxID=3137372 RepID=UPI0031398657
MRKQHSLTIGLLAAAALAACGGSGSDVSDPVVSETPAPAATPGTFTLAGTAAKGAALAAATVKVKCATGADKTETKADGSYSLTLTGATLPCALEVTGTEGSVFHSVVPGSGGSGSYTANITPLTTMMVAQLAGASPANYFADFGSNTAVSPAAVTQALDYIKTAVASITDLGTMNPLSDALVVGNPLDQKIDAVMSALTSAKLTLQDVTNNIASNPAAPAVLTTPLAPAAGTCAWLKSGKFRMINPAEPDPKWRHHVLSIDAKALQATDQDGVKLNFEDKGKCLFSVTGSSDGSATGAQVMVASGGVLLAHNQPTANDPRSLAVGLPEQNLPLAELAGTWSIAVWDNQYSNATANGQVAVLGEIELDAKGAIISDKDCLGIQACTAVAGPSATLTSNSTGGFDLNQGGSKVGRAFLYKSLGGQAVFIFVSDEGNWGVGTRKQALPAALPAVGTVNHYREVSLSGNGSISALREDSNTVTAIDVGSRSLSRLRASDQRGESYVYDKPRDGLRYRAPNSCTFAGVPGNCAEVVGMPLQGMGINLSLSTVLTPSSAFFNVAVGKPD